MSSNSSDDDTESPTLKYMRYMRESDDKMQRALARLRENPLYSTQLCPVVKAYEDKKDAEVELPSQFTFEDWTSGLAKKAEAASNTKCYHDWKLYQGLNFDDFYCLKCGETRPLDPTK